LKEFVILENIKIYNALRFLSLKRMAEKHSKNYLKTKKAKTKKVPKIYLN